MSKLTLHVEEELISKAKAEAANRRTSVSKLVSEYFKVLSAKPGKFGPVGLPPVTTSLVGCLAGLRLDEAGGREAYIDHLEAKHS